MVTCYVGKRQQSLLIFFDDLVSTYFGGHFMPESTARAQKFALWIG